MILGNLRIVLKKEPRQGIQIKPDIYKVRIAIKSKGKGKSGGARIITFVETQIVEIHEKTVLHLITVYDKSETGNVSANYVESVIKEVLMQRAEEE